MNASPLLQLRGVTKRFGDSTAVRALDLEVGSGEYCCILGPSGSGKSTLLRLIAGFERLDEGEIHLGGARLDTLPPERRELHTVFQGYALFPHLTVFENVAFGLRMRGLSRAGLDSPVREALALVGLEGYDERSPGSLSGGEQQRVALARALVNRPRLLLLDEPLSALDRKLRLRMQGELARIQRETGISFVHVTHDQEEALRLSDRLAVMRGGELLRVGTPEEVYRDPRSPFVADFLGSANLFRTRTEADGILLPDGTRIRHIPGVSAPTEGMERSYAIRPEALHLEEAPGREVRMEGRLVSRRRIGALDELLVEVGSNRWIVHAHGSTHAPRPALGSLLHLWFDPRDLIALTERNDEIGEGAATR